MKREMPRFRARMSQHLPSFPSWTPARSLMPAVDGDHLRPPLRQPLASAQSSGLIIRFNSLRHGSGNRSSPGESAKWPDTKLLLISASPVSAWPGGAKDDLSELPPGRYAFLPKPFAVSDLKQAVQGLLGSRTLREAQISRACPKTHVSAGSAGPGQRTGADIALPKQAGGSNPSRTHAPARLDFEPTAGSALTTVPGVG